MSFPSILFERPEDFIDERQIDAPDFFVDLNLDQIIAAVTAGREEYNLKPFFYYPLNRIGAIEYRHEIMQDLENAALSEHVKSFSQQMRTVREHLAQADKLHYNYQKEAWFLDAVEVYCDAVNCLADNLSNAALKSRGFSAFGEYLANYAGSAGFTSLLAETKQLKADLAAARYCVLIKGNGFEVRKYGCPIRLQRERRGNIRKIQTGGRKRLQSQIFLLAPHEPY